jgi:hypothetical protein
MERILTHTEYRPRRSRHGLHRARLWVMRITVGLILCVIGTAAAMAASAIGA